MLNLTLDRVPEKHKEIFEKQFDVAEIAKFNKEQLDSYEESFKYYRDMKNSLDTASDERAVSIAKKMHMAGESIEKTAQYTNLTIEKINEINRNGK